MLAGLRTKTSSAAAKLFFKRNPCIVFHSQIISRVWSVVGKKRKHLFSKRPWKVERWIFSPLLLFFLFVCSLLNINRLLCSCLASPPTSTSVTDLTHVWMHAQFSSTFLFLSFPFLLPEVKTGSLFLFENLSLSLILPKLEQQDHRFLIMMSKCSKNGLIAI